MAKFEFKVVAMKRVIFVQPANDAVEFYKRAFGAEEVKKADQEMKLPFVVSAEMKLAGYTLLISDDTSAALGVGGSVFILELETGDVKEVVQQAIEEGAQVEVADGARVGKVKDSYSNLWIIGSPAAVKQVVDSDIGPPSAYYMPRAIGPRPITPRSAAEGYFAVRAIHEEEDAAAAAAAACSQEYVLDDEDARVRDSSSSDEANPKENDYDGVLTDEVDDDEEEY